MSPEFNRLGPCLIVLAEWKPPVYASHGIRLITASMRRNSPQTLDSKIHHNNLLNNILAKIEADFAGVEDALMLDLQGFVSETNATNIFAVVGGGLVTPRADSCLPGITRQTIIELARTNKLGLTERNVSLTEIYCAEEAFVTGTMGEITPILQVDGRTVGNGQAGELTRRLQALYQETAGIEGELIPE
jgi:branched-subunit amino acid aminotransferase/4-amino-4-deoxychorismate lyase